MNRLRTWAVALTLIFLAVLAADVYAGLRGGAGWRWPYAPPENWGTVVVLLVVVGIYVLSVARIRWESIPRWLALGWLVLAGTLIALSAIGVRGDAGFLLFTRTVSPVQTGASTLAVRTLALEGPAESLARWPQVMEESLDANLIHFTTSPPGQPLVHYTLAQAFEAVPALSTPLSMALRPFQCSNDQVMAYTRGELSSALFGMFMPLWAALTVIPLYASGVLLTGDRPASLRLAQWWPLVPSVLLFAPTWNTIYPLLGVSAFAFLLASFQVESTRARALQALGAGFIMSVASFLNFAILPLFLFYGLFTLGWWHFIRRGEGGVIWPVRMGLWFGLGLSIVWVVYGVASGVSPLEILEVTFGAHGELVQRDYLPWLILHPYDTLMFAGWPLTALFAGGVWQAFRYIRQGNPVHVLALATLITLVMVNLAGVVQGENARILSFYAPFLLLAGVGVLVSHGRGWDVPLLVTQALTVVIMAAFLPVVPLDLNPQPQAPRSDFPLMEYLDLRPVDATFTSEFYRGAFRLDGYRFVADPARQAISLELAWEGAARVERPYQFEVVAYAQNSIDGEIVTEPARWDAQFGYYLPTCWRAGERVHDLTLIELPPVAEPVVWSLELRAVDSRTGDIMQVGTSGQPTDNSVMLGPIPYP